MKILVTTMSIAVWLSCLSAGAVERENMDIGKQEFESKCSSCHGVGGKGDGVVTPIVMDKPVDLTTLAKRNGGVFPAQRVYEIIDGRREVAAHGSRAMPVWGKEFQVNVPSLPQGTPSGNIDLPEVTARNKIKALVDYLSKLQVSE